ncbi:hypothetical protein LPYR103PRE_10690 [Segatella asaccharophila]
MPVNRNALIRYRTLDECFRDFYRRYYREDLQSACSGSDDDPGVDTSAITLYAGDSIAVSGATAITSSNQFLAYVTKQNQVKGFHIGQTSVTVNGKYNIPVAVKGKYSFYDDPIVNWGCDEAYVKARQSQGTLSSSSTSDYLIYNDAGKAEYIAYKFEDGKLVDVISKVNILYSSEFLSYLSERFVMTSFTSDGKTYVVGWDALKLSDATVIDMFSLYDTTYLLNVYMRPEDYDSSSTSSVKILKKLQAEQFILRP